MTKNEKVGNERLVSFNVGCDVRLAMGIDHIVYIETCKPHYVKLHFVTHTDDVGCTVIRANISDLDWVLPRRFVKEGRNLIINEKYIHSYDSFFVKLRHGSWNHKISCAYTPVEIIELDFD